MLRVLTWNVQWASGGRLPLVRERLEQADADVLVVTEGSADVIPPGYDVVSPELRAVGVEGIDRRSTNGRPLSDHDGVIVDIEPAGTP